MMEDPAPNLAFWRRPEVVSNFSSLALTGALAVLFIFVLPDQLKSAPPAPAAPEIQLSLAEPAEQSPDAPKTIVDPQAQPPEPTPPEPQPEPVAQPKPEPVTPEGVLPPPKPEATKPEATKPEPQKKKPEPKKEEKPKPRKKIERKPEPPEHVAGAPRAERIGPVVARHGAGSATTSSQRSSGSANAFRSCLQSHAHYPTSKEARLQNPHGAVGVSVSISGGSIVGASVTSSSGSMMLDQAARSSVLSSGCGSQAGGASSLTGRIVF